MGLRLEQGLAFNVDQRGFTFGQPSQSLKNGNLVILYANPTKRAECEMQPACLSPEEARRYHSYKSSTAAHQFLRGRALIRSLLASYLGAAESQIQLTCQEHIKPEAHCSAASIAIPRFNLSHSGEWIVLGVHQDKHLGIDIECTPSYEIDALISVAGLFTTNERGHLARALADQQRTELFLRLWRSKEAVMKATGLGFALSPDSFEMLAPDGTFRKTVDAEGQTWEVTEVTLRPGLDCAIATQHADTKVPPKELNSSSAKIFSS